MLNKIILSICFLSSASLSFAAVEFNAASTTTEDNQTVDISLSAVSAPAFSSLLIDLTYDASVMQINTVTKASSLNECIMLSKINTGHTVIGYYCNAVVNFSSVPLVQINVTGHNPNRGSSINTDLTLRERFNEDETDVSLLRSFLIVNNTNHSPVVDTLTDRQVNKNQDLTFTVTASDPDLDAVILTASNLPAGATFDSQSGIFSWHPLNNQGGDHTVSFTATDGNLTDTKTMHIAVLNRAPVLDSIQNQSVVAGHALSFIAHADDADSDALTYTSNNLPAGASLDSTTGEFSWTPDSAQTANINITASDNTDTDSKSVQITVTPAIINNLVLDPIANQTIYKNTDLTFSISASNAQDPGNLIFSAANLPTGATFTAATKTFFWRPTNSQAGDYSVTFRVDEGNDFDEKTIHIVVNNHAPEIATIAPVSVVEGEPVSILVNATDADNDNLIYSASHLPSGATFNDTTHELTWTPTHAQIGVTNVTFTVTDDTTPVSSVVPITVTEQVDPNGNNHAPVLAAITDKEIYKNTDLSFTVSATDEDNDNLVYSASNLPQGANFDSASHEFTWHPTIAQAGIYTITFSVSDTHLSDSKPVRITVLNHAPVLDAMANQTVIEGQPLTLTFHATDADTDTLSYSSNNLPSGALLDSASGELSWTPSSSQTGIARFDVSAFDGTDSDTKEFQITVSHTNRPPVLGSITDKEIYKNTDLSVTVSATDPDQNNLIFSASNLPSGASFDPNSHVFTWHPTNAQAGRYSVTFNVSDSSLSDSHTMNIMVNNHAPVMNSIAAQSVEENSLLSFTVTATDADSDALVYSASNLPDGASFDVTRHTFTWTPNSNQIGTLTIVLSVNDGTDSVSQSVQISVSSLPPSNELRQSNNQPTGGGLTSAPTLIPAYNVVNLSPSMATNSQSNTQANSSQSKEDPKKEEPSTTVIVDREQENQQAARRNSTSSYVPSYKTSAPMIDQNFEEPAKQPLAPVEIKVETKKPSEEPKVETQVVATHETELLPLPKNIETPAAVTSEKANLSNSTKSTMIEAKKMNTYFMVDYYYPKFDGKRPKKWEIYSTNNPFVKTDKNGVIYGLMLPNTAVKLKVTYDDDIEIKSVRLKL